MPFVLDASATAAWCFPDENALAANAAFDRFAHENALVPALWWAEVRNVLIVGDRNPTSDLVLALARRHRLTAYDAIYLELAGRFGIPLATLDARLAGAARAKGTLLLGMQQ